jgi:hypothetical protein
MCGFRITWSNDGTLPFHRGISNSSERRGGHVQVGSLGGAPQLGKDSLATPRSAQAEQKPAEECNGKSWPDGTLDRKGSRHESVA